MQSEILNLNVVQRNHSLVVIPNSKDEQKLLVYYDERWGCKLFLNYKTQEKKNETFIMDEISADLQLNKSQLNLQYVASKVQEKYSVSHNENRIYNHRLYKGTIEGWEKETQDHFVINGKHYYWISIFDMESDANIAKKNLEVVDFVKEAVFDLAKS